jgi:hypothetical protein
MYSAITLGNLFVLFVVGIHEGANSERDSTNKGIHAPPPS